MHKVNPKDLPELKIVDITVARAVVIFATVTLFFVMPVLGISYLQGNPVNIAPVENTTGQVAGASTEALPSTSFLGVDMGTQQGLLLTIGIILVGISLVVVLFLIAESVKKKD